jgi:cytidyltransferase-like protein
MKTIVLVTGGFDPLHSGHIAYFEAAKQLGDELWVGLNSDAWLANKKGRHFMPITERASIVKNLRMVDRVVTDFDDSDGSASGAIHKAFTLGAEHIIFANGGDRGTGNTPEQHDFRHTPNIEFVFGIGGEDKRNSSSWILTEWKAPKTERQWGYYRVLHENGPGVKVKELTVDPGKTLSMQRHDKRAEHWFVSEGTASVYTLNSATDIELIGTYGLHKSLHINTKEWHMLANETNKPLKIVEIQYGEECVEEDIERRHN